MPFPDPLLRIVLIALPIIALSTWLMNTASKPRTVDEVIASWGSLGVNLPEEEDVAFIRGHLPDSLTPLQSALRHNSQDVRMAAAYVAEKLGNHARPIVACLIERLRVEPDPIVRVYLASASAEIGHVEADGINDLENAFHSEKNEQAKTHIAGALVRLRPSPDGSAEWEWLLNSLKAFPPTPPAGIRGESVFWERRWGAVEHLREIESKGNTVLPLLRSLRSNKKTPEWVIEQQIAPAIKEIESRIQSANKIK